MSFKRYAWAVFYSLLLVTFTAYVLLDTFVNTRIYSVVPQAEAAEGSTDSRISVEEDVSPGKTAEGSSLSRSSLSGGHEGQEEAIEGNSLSRGSESQEGATEGNADSRGDTLSDASLSDGSSGQASEEGQTTPLITESSYTDENISITLTEYREYDSSIYVAEVHLSSAEYLQTAFAQNAYGKNVTAKTSAIAESNDAILAINGDYYGAREKGYVLRDGLLYRRTASSDQEDLVIDQEGNFSVITEEYVSAEELLAAGAQQIFSFGPALVIDGSIAVTQKDEVGKAMVSNPRTAIAMIDELHYLFVVSDGRTKESQGLTLYELASFLQTLGVKTAYNLDGGGSSTMYFNGRVINNPTTNGKSIKERSVSDIVYIGY